MVWVTWLMVHLPGRRRRPGRKGHRRSVLSWSPWTVCAGSALSRYRGGLVLIPDAGEEFLGGFVVRVLRHEATFESPLQYALP